jgi:GGDEF domain-containing protein
MFGSSSANAIRVTDTHGDHGRHTPIQVFLDRGRFEAGISRILGASHAHTEDCAILYVSVQSSDVELHDAYSSRKLLNLVGNILRARVHAGALAYLGHGEFAVMLQDVSARGAVAYSRSVLSVLSDIRMQWQGKTFTVSAHVGAVMTEGRQEGDTLLDLAQKAGRMAKEQPGFKVHMVHDQEENPRSWLLDSLSFGRSDAQTGSHLAAHA